MSDLKRFCDLANKTSVDYAVNLYIKNGLKIPSPNGYSNVSMCNSINVFAPWEVDHGYKTLLNKNKVHIIKQFANIAPNNIAIELGVYMGGITRMLLDMGFDVTSFDTFEGIAGSTDDDFHSNGEFSSGDISEYIKGANIIKGILPGSLEDVDLKVGFAHFDLDVYEPTKDSLSIVWDMMVPNGIIIFDDYGGWTTQGVKKAVDEFEAKKVYLPTGQMVMFK